MRASQLEKVMPVRAKRPMRSQRARLTEGAGVAHGLAPGHRVELRSNRFDRAVVGGRIDLRVAAILRVRWPLRQTCALVPRVACPRVPRRRSGGPTLSPHRPTLADVAAAAHVSVSTASLAFSGAGPIAAATRQRVLDAAAALDYSGPNPLGRQLRRGRSGIVGVVVGDSLRRSFRDPVSIQVLDGLVSTLGPLDLGVLLIPGSSDPAGPAVDPLLETAAMDVAVIMWGGTTDDPMLGALRRRGTPTVLVEGQHAAGRGVGRASTTAVGCGRPRSTCSRSATPGSRRSRSRSTAAAARARRARPDGPPRLGDHPPPARRGDRRGRHPVAIWETPASLVEHGRTAGIALLSAPDRPTAIACQSDLLASGVVLAARELGLRVPEDVSVSGFDGLDLPWLAPDVLTTVVQPLAEKGAAIGHAVEDFLAGEGPSPRELPVEPADRHDDRVRPPDRQLRRTTAWALPSTRTPVDGDGQVDAGGAGLGVEGADDGDHLDGRRARVGHRDGTREAHLVVERPRRGPRPSRRRRSTAAPMVHMPCAMTPGRPTEVATRSFQWIGLKSPLAPAYRTRRARSTVISRRATSSPTASGGRS